MRRSVPYYIAGILLAATAAVCILGLTLSLPPERAFIASLTLCLAGMFAMVLRCQLPEGSGHGTVAGLPFMAAAAVAPTWHVPLLFGLAVIIVHRFQGAGSPGWKIVFNAGQSVLASALSILVYRAMGGRGLVALNLSEWGAVIGLIVTHALANTILVHGIIAMNEGKPFFAMLRRNVIGMVVIDVFVTPLVFGLGIAFTMLQIPLACLLTLTLLGAHYFYVQGQQLAKVHQELLQLMVKAIEARDPYTSGHSRRVSWMSVCIAEVLNVSQRQRERIKIAGLLHDVGKMHEKYASILASTERLTKDQWITMQEHPGEGAELVGTISQLHDIVPAVRHHHEAWDGSGYPDRLEGEAIPLWARIIAFADTIDAMTTDRPYRRAMTEAEVRAEVIRCAGKQFDPSIAETLLASPRWPALFGPIEADGTRYGLELVGSSASETTQAKRDAKGA